jgi:glyoxylase-like metal-dependent hydrolase (beta-lactamase superfamily II)
MDIRSFHEPGTGTWTYLLGDPGSGRAAVIDPVWGYDAASGLTDRAFIDEVLAAADREGWRIDWVLETHAHADHLSAACLVRAQTGAKIACGAGITSVQRHFARVFNLPDLAADGRQFDRLLREGDVVAVGGLEVHVLETPGHTSDSVSYRVGDAVFVGDTLFAPDTGTARCDFPGGDAGRLYDSVMKLYTLPPQTRLFLCHDYPAEDAAPVCGVTVARSRAENIHIRDGRDRADFVAQREARDRTLALPRLILPALQVNIRAGCAPATEDNGVSYLKIPLNRTIEELISGDEE